MGKGADAIALILDKVSKKGGTSSEPEEMDEDPAVVGLEAQVEKFFAKGQSGDFKAATSALRRAVKLCDYSAEEEEEEEDA